MKELLGLILISSILLSCENLRSDINDQTTDSTNDNGKSLIQIQLPFKGNCSHFLTLNWSGGGIFENKDTIWQLNSNSDFHLIIKNQNNIARPILLSKDINGNTIDSLQLFDRECFIGVDSHYQPWIEISDNLEFFWTDTSYYTSIFMNDDPSTLDVFETSEKTDTVINKKVYQIESDGKIKTVANIK